jgi:DNA topoisomerase-1
MAKTTAKKKDTTENTGKEKKRFLVIVESPAKAKTINKILGSAFEIKASMGHIRDFPKKVMGFDAQKNFEPEFEVIPDKKKVVEELNSIAKKMEKVYLAPDPDREGEAIAWHISEVLNVPKKNICRIEFNEITQNAIRQAVETPRSIDMNRVKAQQTRQILDRMVGYTISPILWDKLKNYKLSAGRVQSVAVRLICEREAEIEAFVPKEYWKIFADLLGKKAKAPFTTELIKADNKKIEINNGDEAQKILDSLQEKNVEFKVSKIANRETKRNPQPPFITSTLQREASSKLGYGVSKTMQVAQKLYEGIELGSGPVGLITYMRTDSTRISDEARDAAKEFIVDHYGAKYYPKEPRVYAKKGKNVQDAHEAIRPTYVDKTPESIKSHLTGEQYRVYKLIWERFIASQMESAIVNNTTVDISAGNYIFRIGGSKIIFDGFLKIYDDRNEGDERGEGEEKPSAMPDLKEGEVLQLVKLEPKQNFTQPPPRYTEASLVKVMEENGIGRPSTYAPIISKIQQRGYVVKEEKTLAPTLLGKVVNEQLVKHFADVVDFKFTADMETKLDDIAENTLIWNKVLADFYTPFMETANDAKEKMEDAGIINDKPCPNCGKPMKLRTSRWGSQFLGCSGYPECKTMMPLDGKGQDKEVVREDKPTDEVCDKCNSPMVIRKGPYGDYLACTKEECKNRKKIVIKTGVKCAKEGCSGELIQRKSRFGKVFYGCDKYPDCDYILWNEPNGGKCPTCGAMLVNRYLKKGNKISCSKKECSFEKDMEEG